MGLDSGAASCYRNYTMKSVHRDEVSPHCCETASGEASTAVWRDDDEELALLAKALAHPARVRIVRFLLAQGEDTCICGDICEEIPLAQSTVSQHLGMLKRAGIIYGRVDGPRVCYCVDREQLAKLEGLLTDL
jgi:ArsR family transcriptional regulator, arsenate/arsenite/antimonite-responsive transcriptional repressor